MPFRKPFQFSLRTLLVVLTAFAVWLGLQKTHVTAKGLERLSTLRNLKLLIVTEGDLGDTTQLAEILKGCKIQ